jgi:hypothetical protein
MASSFIGGGWQDSHQAISSNMAITAMQIRTPTAREERGGDCAASRYTGLIEPPIESAHWTLPAGIWIKQRQVI